MRDAVDHVVVVIPARDEQQTVAAAVRAVLTSGRSVPGDVALEVVVVADACDDATAVRARHAGAHVVEIGAGNVGAARRIGCEWALARPGDPSRLWLATTDADSVVPAGWLPAQLEASRCADLFLGTIRLSDVDHGRHAAWGADYALRADGAAHGHVHGASLGVRGSAYLAVGGFHDLPAHEDADLVGRLLAQGIAPVWDDCVPVMTSARHVSRVPEGVGADLAASSIAPTRLVPTDPRPACMRSALPGM
jgi:glycosyltransferase involved in cell wall biosynthesis